jgi:hypothetical protein
MAFAAGDRYEMIRALWSGYCSPGTPKRGRAYNVVTHWRWRVIDTPFEPGVLRK